MHATYSCSGIELLVFFKLKLKRALLSVPHGDSQKASTSASKVLIKELKCN